MGTPDFALPSLKILLEHQYQIASVVTSPDKPKGRGQRISSSPIKEFACEKNLPILQPEDLRHPSFVNQLMGLKPDLIVVVAFRILPQEIFTLPRYGSLNLHASLLPRYRGAAPINWAIIRGEKETGVTTFYLKEKVDTGGIILQARVKIGPDETAGELQDKLAEVGAEIVLQSVRLIELGKVTVREQEEQLATTAPKIFKEDCRIDWNRSAQDVHNFVRGLSPSPTGWTRHGETVLKIYATQLLESSTSDTERARALTHPSKPGQVVCVSKDLLLVQTNDGPIALREIQQEGRKRMTASEFLRGYSIKVDDVLE